MKPTNLCPCGSGKSQIHCCGDHPKSRINLRLLVTWSFIILLACGIGAIAFARFQDDAPSPAVGSAPAPIQLSGGGGVSGTVPSVINPGGTSITLGTGSGSEVPAPTNITNPSAWQYDAATDKHYDPNHAHWHGGPPPSNPITAPPGSGSGPTPGSKVSAPPNIPNPLPWQFDAETYSYYDPGHAHWHSGRPPSGPNAAADPTSGGRVDAPPNIPNPSPWQYDAATYKYYDPNHGHWHSGPPPNDPNAPAVPVAGTEVPAPPNISNPSPWQYDVVTDKHYDPNHAHWHNGQPPLN